MLDDMIKDLVLDYFAKTNCKIIEKGGLFDIEVSKEIMKEFNSGLLRITFNEELARNNNYDLITPGNNILFKIINQGIQLGSVLSCKSRSESVDSAIRFYFYIVFESIKSKTWIKSVDVEMKSLKIVNIKDDDIAFDEESENNISPDTIDDCYLASTDFLEKSLKNEIDDFKKEILSMKEIEINNIEKLQSKQLFEIQEKSIDLQRSPNEDSFDNLVLENANVRKEQVNIRKQIERKYHITIDFALIAAVCLIKKT